MLGGDPLLFHSVLRIVPVTSLRCDQVLLGKQLCDVVVRTPVRACEFCIREC